MIHRSRLAAAFALLCLGALLSGLLLLAHHGVGTPADALCGPGVTTGCDVVNQSAWSEVAGIPVAAWGLAFYVSLAGLAALAASAPAGASGGAARLAFLGVAGGLAVDLGLLGIQAFALRAYCVLCIATYGVNALVLGLLWPARRAREAVGALLLPEHRALGVGWALTTAVALAGALAWSGALAGRASANPAEVLGTGGSDELQRAREEAKRLQAILDDPRRLEQYFAEKAQREFDTAPVHPIDLAGVPAKGPADAPVKVVTYSDFQCPFCRQLALGLNQFLPRSGGRIALYFKNYPLDPSCNENLRQEFHGGACWMALGSLCAQQQGRFWEYHDRVFAREWRGAGRADVLRLAAETGLTVPAFEACLDSPRTLERLKSEIREAAAGGVNATPTVFLNGKRLPRVDDFVRMVDQELLRLGEPPLPQPRAARR
jgi:protein-disulfide isomerase/uncharacterized membrane protein